MSPYSSSCWWQGWRRVRSRWQDRKLDFTSCAELSRTRTISQVHESRLESPGVKCVYSLLHHCYRCNKGGMQCGTPGSVHISTACLKYIQTVRASAHLDTWCILGRTRHFNTRISLYRETATISKAQNIVILEAHSSTYNLHVHGQSVFLGSQKVLYVQNKRSNQSSSTYTMYYLLVQSLIWLRLDCFPSTFSHYFCAPTLPLFACRICAKQAKVCAGP